MRKRETGVQEETGQGPADPGQPGRGSTYRHGEEGSGLVRFRGKPSTTRRGRVAGQAAWPGLRLRRARQTRCPVPMSGLGHPGSSESWGLEGGAGCRFKSFDFRSSLHRVADDAVRQEAREKETERGSEDRTG